MDRSKVIPASILAICLALLTIGPVVAGQFVGTGASDTITGTSESDYI